MSAPGWARWLLGRLAGADRVDEVLGDLEETHRDRVARRGRPLASVLTALETLDMAAALLREPRRGRRAFRTPARADIRSASRSKRAAVSWLDLKLGARMLSRYPGVTIVGGLAMMIGVGLGAGYLEIVNDFLHPNLPLEDGDRIVGVQTWDAAENDPELRTLHDFLVWRDEVASIQDLSAYRSIERNLGPTGGDAEPARGAEITPSAFRVTRVRALLGRPLIDEDGREGAPPVVVLGHRLWRSRFGGDAGIVGERVRLGASTGVVVGVMPEGFAFPVSHDFWTPLQVDALSYAPREGPPIRIFGRLAPGATLEEARAELTALGSRAAADLPATHEHLRPRVVPYTELFVGGGGSGRAYAVQFLFVVVLLILASNVATMVFARTATRENEIGVRFALGASRGRILAQLFAEALVLALAAAAIGVAIVAQGAGWVTRLFWQVTERETPFWLDGRLNPTTVLYALLLAVLAAVVAGVLPGLRATRPGLQTRLGHPAGASGSAMRFGGLWGAVIAVQVALAVLVLPPAIIAISALAEAERADAGFPTDEYLSARIELDPERPPADPSAGEEFAAAFEARYEELRRRLLEEPGVSGVTFATRLPGMDHPNPFVQVDSGGAGAGITAPRWVMSTSVDPTFFDAFGAGIVAGRGLRSGDAAADPPVVVVNETFVRQILRGRSAIGRRVRSTGRVPGPWQEIVGVVSDLGMDTDRDAFHPGRGPGIYHPLRRGDLAAGGSRSVRVAFHVRGDPAAFAPRLRELARAVDPSLRLYDVLPLDRPLDAGNRTQRLVARFASWTTALVGAIAVLISIAGTYSVMSFTVSRQTREIGIRIALGADRRRIVRAVFSRAMLQIGAGLLVGTAAWFYFMVYVLGGGDEIGLLVTTAGVLMLVGLAACGVPVRRALRIQPTEALREVG
ncbi:MAG: ABC transporter permease [Gemmatimonadetes bacterium]|nr:ABC transporter permease [Gemmatimonadota bacterium]